MTEQPVFWIIGLIAVGLASWYIVRHHFSPEARLERKRRKSHSRVVTKAKKPMVLFSVKTPKS
jgi:hypothetical protein